MSNLDILAIPDTQTKEGVPVDHLEAVGNYIRAKRPRCLVVLGDFGDMHGLSSYDLKKRAGEGVRVEADLIAIKDGMQRMMKPWKNIKSYSPELHILEGNHDGCSDCPGTRMYRYIEEHPELDGVIPQPLDCFKEAGWDVHHFTVPWEIEGVLFSHLFPATSTGNVTNSSLRMGAPDAAKQCKFNHSSTVAGHKPGLDVKIVPVPGTSRKLRGLIAGSFYMHDESYRGNAGNNYWRGCVMMHRVKNGYWSQTEVDLDYLLEAYL